MTDDYEYWDNSEQRKENMKKINDPLALGKKIGRVLIGLAFVVLVVFAAIKSKASEPAPGVIVLTEIESKQLIEKAQAAETARREFAIAYETICKLRGVKDPAQYDLAPNAEHKELVNLVPKPPAQPQK